MVEKKADKAAEKAPEKDAPAPEQDAPLPQEAPQQESSEGEDAKGLSGDLGEDVDEDKEEMVNDENGQTPVARSGLSSISQDDLNPAFAVDTSK